MTIASETDVQARLSAYVKASGDSPVVITRNGKVVAAIIPLSDADDLERLRLSYSPRLRATLRAARRRVRAGRSVPHREFWSEPQKRPPRKPRRTTA